MRLKLMKEKFNYYDHLQTLIAKLLPNELHKNFDETLQQIVLQNWWDSEKVVMPLAIYQHFIQLVKNKSGRNPEQIELVDIQKAHQILIAHQWSKFKQIFLFDEYLTKELIQTPLSNQLPVDFLENQLPFPCFYLATPGIIKELEILGFFVFLNRDYQDSFYELRIIVDNYNKNIFVPLALPLIHDLEKALEITYENTFNYQKQLGKNIINVNQFDDVYRQALTIVMNHIYYLSADNKDIEIKQKRTVKKGKSNQSKSPKYPQVNQVGVNISKYFLTQYTSSNIDSNSSSSSLQNKRHVAPHLRRAHWHTYQIGKGGQKRIIKWINPVLVNSDKIDNLPVSIKKLN